MATPNAGFTAEIKGLDEFRADLRPLANSKRWDRELGAEQRVIARKVAGRSAFAAHAMGGPQAHFADAIKGRGGVTGAKIQIADQDANAAFWGAKQNKTGWNAHLEGTGPNQPPWVGASWDAWKGEGPYAIAPTIQAMWPEIERDYAAGIERVALAASAYWTADF